MSGIGHHITELSPANCQSKSFISRKTINRLIYFMSSGWQGNRLRNVLLANTCDIQDEICQFCKGTKLAKKVENNLDTLERQRA